MKKWLIVSITGLVLMGAAVSAVLLLPRKSVQQSTANETAIKENVKSEEKTVPASSDTVLADGRYASYAPQELASKSYDTTILFFHAPWCIECRGFEMAINEGALPKGVQILKVDYDSSTGLRKQYGITIQSTFVRVDSDGKKQATWVGYGKDKTVEAIIQNTK